MKIEIGKKYKTRNGCNVTIERIAFDRAYGVIECAYKDGLFTVWWADGGILINSEMKLLGVGSGDLVEIKEDWEILIEHFEKNETLVAVKNNCSTHICTGINKTKNANIFKLKVVCDDSIVRDVYMYRHEIYLATLEDCKQYILEK